MEKTEVTHWFCTVCWFGASVQYRRAGFIPRWIGRLTVRDLFILNVTTRYHDDMIDKIEEWHDGCVGRIERI